jgi:transposase-like protein
VAIIGAKDRASISAVNKRMDAEPGRFARRRLTEPFSLSDRESQFNWRDFLVGLRERGLHGVDFIVSDDQARLKSAIRKIHAGAARQCCYVHFLMNVLDYITRKADDDCLQGLRRLYDRRDLAEARRDLAAQFRKQSGKILALTDRVSRLRRAKMQKLTHTVFPGEGLRRLWLSH